MPTHSRKRHPLATRRRALELLAASLDGCTEAMMVAHGFTIDMLVKLSLADSWARIEKRWGVLY
jgi:hypothetical protein